MTPKEYKRARKRLTREGILIQIGVRNGEPVYGFAPVDPAIEALAVLALPSVSAGDQDLAVASLAGVVE
jgi:hypothetical protein